MPRKLARVILDVLTALSLLVCLALTAVWVSGLGRGREVTLPAGLAPHTTLGFHRHTVEVLYRPPHRNPRIWLHGYRTVTRGPVAHLVIYEYRMENVPGRPLIAATGVIPYWWSVPPFALLPACRALSWFVRRARRRGTGRVGFPVLSASSPPPLPLPLPEPDPEPDGRTTGGGG